MTHSQRDAGRCTMERGWRDRTGRLAGSTIQVPTKAPAMLKWGKATRPPVMAAAPAARQALSWRDAAWSMPRRPSWAYMLPCFLPATKGRVGGMRRRLANKTWATLQEVARHALQGHQLALCAKSYQLQPVLHPLGAYLKSLKKPRKPAIRHLYPISPRSVQAAACGKCAQRPRLWPHAGVSKLSSGVTIILHSSPHISSSQHSHSQNHQNPSSISRPGPKSGFYPRLLAVTLGCSCHRNRSGTYRRIRGGGEALRSGANENTYGTRGYLVAHQANPRLPSSPTTPATQAATVRTTATSRQCHQDAGIPFLEFRGFGLSFVPRAHDLARSTAVS